MEVFLFYSNSDQRWLVNIHIITVVKENPLRAYRFIGLVRQADEYSRRPISHPLIIAIVPIYSSVNWRKNC